MLGQSTLTISGLSPKRGWGPKLVTATNYRYVFAALGARVSYDVRRIYIASSKTSQQDIAVLAPRERKNKKPANASTHVLKQ